MVLEGGSKERDNVDWMIKYNRPKIQPVLKKNVKKTKITRQDRIEHVNWCMSQLQLTPIRDALISELSLEQKKRLTIGVELAANPSLLWLDEPTSGLDSIAALRVMKAIKQISDAGVAVVCTLHQPSELIFSWCSHLLLLAKGLNVYLCTHRIFSFRI